MLGGDATILPHSTCIIGTVSPCAVVYIHQRMRLLHEFADLHKFCLPRDVPEISATSRRGKEKAIMGGGVWADFCSLI